MRLILIRYTQFYTASTEGTPIIRPMWYEYPNDTECFNLNTQFMWGDQILVAPKLRRVLYKTNKYFFPKSEDDYEKWWAIDVYFPEISEEKLWYYYSTKIKVDTSNIIDGYFLNMLLENHEVGAFVRGGSILPIKIHRGALSLLRTKHNPIRLDIYLSNEGTAKGRLYLDDGESFRYQISLEQALIEYEYKDNKLTCYNALDSHYKYEAAQYLKIVEVNFYGIYRPPQRVKSSYRRRQYLDFEYLEAKQTLTVENLNYPVDSDVRGQKRTILEIDFS